MRVPYHSPILIVMASVCLWSLLLSADDAKSPPKGQTGSILIRADVDCRFSFDGKVLGPLKADGTKEVRATAGEHLLVGEDKRGRHWEKVIGVEGGKQKVVLAECRGAEPEEVQKGRRQADSGDVKAQLVMARIYEEGLLGVAPDKDEALYWYLKAAEQGEGGAEAMLASKYEEGRITKQDFSEAVRWERKAAEQGLRGAQMSLAKSYDEGRGVKQDYAEALKWYLKAADHRFEALETMEGVSLDMQKQLFDLVTAKAAYNIGLIYADGSGVKQNYPEAAQWLRKAAELNVAQAEGALGTFYSMGKGVPQDNQQAALWYRKAAEQGDMMSQVFLAGMYWRGEGVAQDNSEAVRWYRKAAEQGQVLAQRMLGFMYEQGIGVSQDETEAAEWYRKAAEQGDDEAQKALSKLPTKEPERK